MKPLFLAVLVAVVCVEQVHSLWCFRCENEPSNANCLRGVKCAERDQYCLTTTQYSVNNSTYKVSKRCSEDCPDRFDVQPGEPATKCCAFSFCNFSGATSVQTSTAGMLLGVVASFFYIFQSGL